MDATRESQNAAGPEGPAAAEPHAVAAAERRVAVVWPAILIWLRHLVPLTLLSAIALSPLIAIALATRAPADLAGAKSVLRVGWTLLAAAWFAQLLLVGGASAMIDRAPATGWPGSQLRAFGAGLARMVRALVPCLVAAAAVLIGCLALVVPGPMLLVLLALTAASRERGLPAPLLDSIAAVRRQLPAVVLALAALFVLDAAIGLIAHRAFAARLPPRPTPVQLAAVRDFVRVIAAALVILSPLPATVLATIRARIKP